MEEIQKDIYKIEKVELLPVIMEKKNDKLNLKYLIKVLYINILNIYETI